MVAAALTFVFFMANNKLQINNARPSSVIATSRNGTFFQAMKKSFENMILDIGWLKIINNEHVIHRSPEMILNILLMNPSLSSLSNSLIAEIDQACIKTLNKVVSMLGIFVETAYIPLSETFAMMVIKNLSEALFIHQAIALNIIGKLYLSIDFICVFE